MSWKCFLKFSPISVVFCFDDSYVLFTPHSSHNILPSCCVLEEDKRYGFFPCLLPSNWVLLVGCMGRRLAGGRRMSQSHRDSVRWPLSSLPLKSQGVCLNGAPTHPIRGYYCTMPSIFLHIAHTFVNYCFIKLSPNYQILYASCCLQNCDWPSLLETPFSILCFTRIHSYFAFEKYLWQQLFFHILCLVFSRCTF